jgi:hypothetical protein
MAVPRIQGSIPVVVAAEPIAGSKSLSTLDDKNDSARSLTDSLSSENDAILKTNPFSDPRVAAHWQQVYDESGYECRHAFDPTLEWTEEEEKRVIRKVDWRVCLWAVCCDLYPLALKLDPS